jgi:hypothetical protein
VRITLVPVTLTVGARLIGSEVLSGIHDVQAVREDEFQRDTVGIIFGAAVSAPAAV